MQGDVFIAKKQMLVSAVNLLCWSMMGSLMSNPILESWQDNFVW